MNEKILKLHELLTSNFKEINDVALKEIEDRIMKAINFNQRKIRDITILEVKIKFKKNRLKYFKEISQGDIFEIYLRDIGKYAYGIVVSGEIKGNKDEEILIGYLNKFSSTALPIDEIFQLVKQKQFLFIANTGITGIKKLKWRFITNYSDKVFSDENLSQIPYKVYFMGKYYKSVGDSVKEIAECEVISKEEADKIPNPLGIVGEEEIENLLIEKFQNTI
ncbi:Imm26 family immunity protein [Geobacillus thermoleovorans]|uniref:Imm26 family immunity protein n=1 Tax=Geobacillus thermoleovorans TaxID=33941 RepID=UPI00345C4018